MASTEPSRPFLREEQRMSSDKQPTEEHCIDSNFKQGFLASIVVLLVARLGRGIAIASGVATATGLFTSMIGGLIAGWFPQEFLR